MLALPGHDRPRGELASPQTAATNQGAGRDRPGLPVPTLGVLAAGCCLAATFRGPGSRFWSRMTRTGLVLGSLALAADRNRSKVSLAPRDVGIGLGSAAILYATFRAGDPVVRRFWPGGGRQVDRIYAWRNLADDREIAIRLIAVIAPAEELFWRGLVQRALESRFGRWRGATLATLAYAGVHTVSGNPMLVAAALVGGGQWSLLAAAGAPMSSLVVSHAVWDVLIFLGRPAVSPTLRRGPSERLAWPGA